MKKIEIDRDRLKTLIEQGYSNTRLAKEFGCSVRVIASRKKEWGLLGLTPNNKTTKIIDGNRKCIKCDQVKPVEYFSKQVNAKQGIRSICKSCHSTESKAYYVKNKKGINARHKDHYNNNSSMYMEKYHKRRAAKLNATPNWYSELDAFCLEEAYDLCKIREQETGLKYHIDHIIPLQGGEVCGLHYHKNWQVITAKENLEKGNKLLEKYKNG